MALVYIIVSRGTIKNVVSLGTGTKYFYRLFGFVMIVGNYLRIVLMFVFAMVALILFSRVDFEALFMKSLYERGFYIDMAIDIVRDDPIVGSGSGQFIVRFFNILPGLDLWQYQPVHNVFLLIWSELGIVGLVLFILFLWKLFHVEQ